jgi:hypothetical protein
VNRKFLSCLATVIFVATVCLAAGIDTVIQTGVQNAQAAGSVTQNASNTVNVDGWDNTIVQSSTQNAWSSGSIIQDASNTANAFDNNDLFNSCIASGGTVVTKSCCKSVSDFPNTCLIGACGCSPDNSKEIRVCDCGPGRCFDGNACSSGASGISQQASNTANVGGSGNWVDQNIDQNAWSSGGGNIWQDADNVANVGGQGSQVSQGITQNAQSGPMKLIIPTGVTPSPASSLQMRALYQGAWALGPVPVCYGNSLDTAIRNDRDQYLRTYEVYPNGQVSVNDLGFHRAGEMVYGMFVGDAQGEHMLRPRGSVSGWSNDIIRVQVVPCGYGGMPYGGGNIWQGASNMANVGGSGNWVDQNIDQNAWSSGGGNIWQDADNVANVNGWGNRVDQDINQNAWSRGGGNIWQDADNVANVGGWGNQVDQDINQNAWA